MLLRVPNHRHVMIPQDGDQPVLLDKRPDPQWIRALGKQVAQKHDLVTGQLLEQLGELGRTAMHVANIGPRGAQTISCSLMTRSSPALRERMAATTALAASMVVMVGTP